jgi:hypothetical protein
MDLNFKSASLKKIIIHFVGSKNNLEPLHFSQNELALEEDTVQMIGEGMLNKFNNLFEYFSFQHSSSLSLNEVNTYVTQLFENKDLFEEVSIDIAKHLYESSTHPKVKGGELYICLFEGLPVEGRMHSAIGIFKTENKAHFIEVQQKERQIELVIKEGVEVNKMDKGCLIINRNKESGYDVLIYDNQNRGEEAAYWKEKFLNITPQKNEYHQTQHFLTLTKQFITEQMEGEFDTPRTDQIEMLTKSIDYFRSKESFNIDEFQKEVFQNGDMIQSFRNFGSKYIESHDFDIASEFDISAQAVKKQARVYKSVLKLDKNFHIYIHGNTDLIEKGVDENGRKFYKIYYQDES